MYLYYVCKLSAQCGSISPSKRLITDSLVWVLIELSEFSGRRSYKLIFSPSWFLSALQIHTKLRLTWTLDKLLVFAVCFWNSPECKANKSQTCDAYIRKVWFYTFTSLYISPEYWFIKHRTKFLLQHTKNSHHLCVVTFKCCGV